MRRLIACCIVLSFMLANLTGCETVAKKFRRKKKEGAKMPRIYQVRKYEKKPTPELYKKHYAYWSSWQSELIEELSDNYDDNYKKEKLCIEQIISNLKDMQSILVPEKGAELAPRIDKLEKMRDIIARGELSSSSRSYILTTVEREERYIIRDFAYAKVKNSLRKSFDEEAPADAAPAPAQNIPSSDERGEPQSVVRLSN